jgi:hypothetical protein
VHECFHLVGREVGQLQVNESRVEGVLGGRDAAGDDDVAVIVLAGKAFDYLNVSSG